MDHRCDLSQRGRIVAGTPTQSFSIDEKTILLIGADIIGVETVAFEPMTKVRGGLDLVTNRPSRIAMLLKLA
jgi:hypothetical protein